MKIIKFTVIMFMAVLISFGCGTGTGGASASKGLVLKGDISNAGNTKISIEKLLINKPGRKITEVATDENGHFEANFPEGLENGIYRLGTGTNKATFVLDGNEHSVTFTGDINQLNRYNYTISGAKDSKVLLDVVGKLMKKKMGIADIKTFVDTVSNPTLGMLVAYMALGGDVQFEKTHAKALARVKADYPDSEYVTDYSKYISSLKQKALQEQKSQKIQVGMKAPDIVLKDPYGKTRKLSDLKGKVVLLDFWASWCRPCRGENPNVVRVYNKYKDKGFTVFSVSLDGLDSRTKARYKTPEQINAASKREKDKWIAAIKQDNLTWKNHVSDLKKWECEPARMYGVRSIPRAFMIDRDGNIASTSVRGAQAIEAMLKDLL